MSCVRLRKARRTLRFIVSMLAGAVLALSGAAAAEAASSFKQNPILFVHGIEGSGAQFESQKMRFMSNGYPAGWFDEVDYNSTRAVADKSEVHQQIDAAIAKLEQRTGKSQVDVVAHSLGTSVMYDYLTNGAMAAQRRANVAHYINVDGQARNPGVPTLAVWAGRGTPSRNMDGATNVTIPNQTHVQACTSAESFVEYYKFLTGRRPGKDIVRQKGSIQVAGKALNFPENGGSVGTTVQIWQVNDSGRRTSAAPVASLPITDGSRGGGAWGPVAVQAATRYEFALVRPGLPTLHVYYEPFPRSDLTLRLLQSVAIEQYAGNRPGSLSTVNIRYKELWGDQGAENDQLLINGLNVCTPGLCPISKQVNAFFAFDRNRDGQTDLSEPDPVLGELPFIQGADVFIPASSPPTGTTSFQLVSRGVGPARTLNVPNWDSSTDGVTIQWNDFE
jgi:triacylglycerol esterase/lipase EstA (alpha/beta hydrolase family)